MIIHFNTDEFNELVPADKISYFRNKTSYWTYAALLSAPTEGGKMEYVFLKYRKIKDIESNITIIPVSQPTDEIQAILDGKSDTWTEINEKQISESDCYEMKRLLNNNLKYKK